MGDESTHASKAPRVIVVGAGIAGLTTAFALERIGASVIVLERARGPRDVGYMLDFFGPGYDAAESLGMLGAIGEIHYPVERLVFVDGTGREQVSLRYADLRRRLFGGRHYNFLRGDLEALLAGAIAPTSIRYGVRVVRLERSAERVAVHLADGEVIEADLLVGADGIHSWVRGEAFGAEAEFRRSLHHVTAACVLDGELDTAYPGAFVTQTVPGRMVGVYPIRGGRMATFFCHRGDPVTGSIGAELRRTYADLGWIVPRLLQLLPADHAIYHDAVDQIVMPRWHDGRVALVGDAAWCVTLLAGQGASLAMAGGLALAEAINAHRASPMAALAAYEAAIRPVVEPRQVAGRRTADWFVPDSAWRLRVRQLALRASGWPVIGTIIGRAMGTRAAT